MRSSRLAPIFCLLLFLGPRLVAPSSAQDSVIATSDRFGVVDNLTLQDPARGGRKIPLTVYYPVGQGHWIFPVIVFSHGAGGSKDGYSYLGSIGPPMVMWSSIPRISAATGPCSRSTAPFTTSARLRKW